jgi:hypothetical protein
MITVTALHYYPIKSCRGWALDSAKLSPRGIENDRWMMLVDSNGQFLTQREHPRMALIEPKIEAARLNLSAPGMPPLEIAIQPDGAARKVVVWRSTCAAVDQGDPVSGWLSSYLGVDTRLVRIADGFERKVNQNFAVTPNDQTGFSDGYPLLLIAEESLDDLNERLDAPLPMNRFRPNLVVRGCDPFAEDTWKRIRINGMDLAVVKPCARCAITTTDQATAERGHEPLKTLATYRKADGKVMFGQNVIHLAVGQIAVGDSVEILE